MLQWQLSQARFELLESVSATAFWANHLAKFNSYDLRLLGSAQKSALPFGYPAISRSHCSLTKANEKRDYRIFADFGNFLITKVQPLYANCPVPNLTLDNEIYDEINDELLVFLTNNFEISSLEVARLYQNRWQIEVFFKWIKQNLVI